MGRQPKNVKLSAAEARVVLLALSMVGLGIAVFFILSITVVQPLLNGCGVRPKAPTTTTTVCVCAVACGVFCQRSTQTSFTSPTQPGTTITKKKSLFLKGRGSKEANCTVISAEIPKWIDCAFECGPYCKGVSSYPCLQVYVNVTPWGRKVLLHRDEQSISSSSQVSASLARETGRVAGGGNCYQLPKCYRDHADATAVIEPLKSSFRALNRTPFRCFYNARVHHDDALFSRSASDSQSLLQCLLWPLLAVAIGAALLLLLALSHTLAGLCENKQTIQHRRKAHSDTARLVARRPWRSDVAGGGGGGGGGGSARPKSRASLRSAGIAIVSFRAVGNSLKGEKHVHLP
uniref:Calcium-activated potassium channel subunit beta-3-like n=1 Tax=Petromyzon marinus TaxID=7757 RepID=A0AAJ7TJU8_PETMA|nr:calcium-activated potassium channel subunit beta-3-like [Petromyzon marinus]